MPKTLKQVAIDMANAFTRWQLWQGGGSTTLSDLTDVELTDLQTDDVLQYDGNKWINAIIQGGGSVGAQVDTLWNNPSPLTSFSGQNVNIDTNYDIFIIDFRPSNNSTIHSTMLVNKVFNRTYRLYCNSGGSQDQQYQRGFTFQNGYVNFDDGLRPGIAWDNSLCIPTVIYGIKFAPIEQNLHEYSTNEKVIGTFNNKNVYEKTISQTINNTQGTIYISDNIDSIISMEGYYKRDNNYQLPLNFYWSPTDYTNTYINTNAISYKFANEYPTNCFITIRYTKTTD